MRWLTPLAAPLSMATLAFGLGRSLQASDMLTARLSYDALGGPAAYVLYAIVVGVGLVRLAWDRIVEAVVRAWHVRRVRSHARRLPSARIARAQR